MMTGADAPPPAPTAPAAIGELAWRAYHALHDLIDVTLRIADPTLSPSTRRLLTEQREVRIRIAAERCDAFSFEAGDD